MKDFASCQLILLDLCWVNSGFLDETFQKIDYYLQQNKRIILIGCISNSIRERYGNELYYIDSKNHVAVESYFEYKINLKKVESYSFKNKISILDTDNDFKQYGELLGNFESKSFIEISTWCEFNCSYCNIKKIKWATKSLAIQDIMDQVKEDFQQWKTDFYLLSDDCGSYGIDTGTTFVDLVEKIFSIHESIRIYITNINPVFFLKYYPSLKKYIFNGRIPYMLLPIQHTSPRILSLMKRWYSIDRLMENLLDMRRNSKIELCNHIIFNYFQETLEEFVDTLKLLQFYDKTFYFKYSDINNIYGNDFESSDVKEKIILLKKLQHKYNIDITI